MKIWLKFLILTNTNLFLISNVSGCNYFVQKKTIDVSKRSFFLPVNKNKTVKINNFKSLRNFKVEVENKEIISVDLNQETGVITINALKIGVTSVIVSADNAWETSIKITIVDVDSIVSFFNKLSKNETNKGKSNELSNYLERLDSEPFPENIKERIKEEINSCPLDDYNTLKYIQWMMNIPWYQKDNEKNNEYDLKDIQNFLDKEHYGVDKVKEKIIEFLALQKMSRSGKGKIICLVGPPGVGKTTFAKSIANALNRPFAKIALGGLRDEAEIRGHRRTYIGAMPGKIIQEMRKAKVLNPVFLLDEIDKIGSSHKGDPAAALLEVLDPNQNANFSDHYIEEDYDLSKVMFIATANYIEEIPAPLKDRMEIIELLKYTELEKVEIAKRYLIPKINEEYNLENKIIYQEGAIEEIIKSYTKESGVRELERLFNRIAGKFAVQYQNGKIITLELTSENVKNYLEKSKF